MNEIALKGVNSGPKKGFALIDALIFVGVIAMLAAVAIPHLIQAKISANESAARSALKAISVALESYSEDKDVLPSDTSSLIGVTPPQLSADYFTGVHAGYVFTATLSDNSYLITAAPSDGNAGTHIYTITTGGVLHEI